MPRSQPGAVLHDEAEVAQRAVRMARDGSVTTSDGSVLALVVATICLHGDSPGAVQRATAVRAAMLAAGVPLAPFANA